MAYLDFYALDDDLRDIFRMLFTETDIVVYEMYSRPDHELRCFHSLDEMEQAFALGTRHAALLQLWSPSVMAEPIVRHIQLSPSTGHRFRYTVEGAGLIQLYLNGRVENVLHYSHWGHWNEAGARKRSIFDADECDWRALAKLSGRIQRRIRGRLASGRLNTNPVLHQAYRAVQNGAGLELSGMVFHSGSPHLEAFAIREE